jgi:hypothetical protein
VDRGRPGAAAGRAIAKATGAGQDRAGRLICGKNLSLPGHPEILVTGDLMSLDELPGVAEVAMQNGLYAARRITQEAQGRTYDKPFKYRDLGSAAYISRRRAVISAGKLHFGGFPGWCGWLFIHISFLTGWRNRLGALLSWWTAFIRDLRRERAFTLDDMPVRLYRDKVVMSEPPTDVAAQNSQLRRPQASVPGRFWCAGRSGAGRQLMCAVLLWSSRSSDGLIGTNSFRVPA